MKTVNWWKWTTVALSAVALAAFANDSDRRQERVGPALAATLKQAFPECHIHSVNDSKQGGEKILRIRLKDSADEQNVLVKVALDGEILELDEDVRKHQVPAPVEQAFRKAFPNARIDHVEKGTRMEISYRFDISQNGRKHEVKVTRRGRIFEVVDRD